MDKKEAIKIITYLITSARGCIDEPKIYGSFRLVDSASKLYSALKTHGLIDDHEIAKVISIIDEKKYSCMFDENEFVEMLDRVIDRLVDVTVSMGKSR